MLRSRLYVARWLWNQQAGEVASSDGNQMNRSAFGPCHDVRKFKEIREFFASPESDYIRRRIDE